MIDQFIRAYRNKTVAVTGAGGYLAAVVIDELRKTPAHILRVSRRDLAPLPGTETIRADVRESDCWQEIVSKADVIFHLAGNTSMYAAARNPSDSLSSTVLPITQLVAAAQAVGHKRRVVFASTATVYGLTDVVPVGESADTKPVTNYDLHKLFAEKQLELATQKGILDGVSLRLANVYGASSSHSSSDDRGVLNKIAIMALQGRNLKLFGDGDHLRDYVHIDDVARAFMAAGKAEDMAGKSFNVGTNRGITVREAFRLVADRVATVTGKRVSIESIPWPEGADSIESRNFVADIAGFTKATGWYPMISLNVGVDMMIESFSRSLKSNSEAP